MNPNKKHLAAAPLYFVILLGTSYSAPFSPSSSVSSRSVTSPATSVTPTKARKKSRVPKTQKTSIKKRRPTVGALEDMKKNDGELNSEGEYSIIRSHESLKDGYNSSEQMERTSFTAKDDCRFRESSDDYYGATSDTSDIIKNDVKLRNRCTVVIKPTKELLQYERRRDELYNEILQKQRRKLELRALEKQREKERRRLSRREEKGNSDIPSEGAEKVLPTLTDKRDARRRSPRNNSDIYMSSESEFETNFLVRSRKQKQQHVKEIQPLASLLNERNRYLFG
ncbi:hypothetical protein DOY81_012663 [Sarcophaga bullata]|nr:hypothetical protein DOY81_012663 [Sarcophaga bullata]